MNLFRICVVYVEGGWYSDWKQECLQIFFLENLSKGAEYFGSWDWGQDRQQKCVQNCLCGATPQHFIVRETLKKILLHVQTQHYTTGPCVLSEVVKDYTDVERVRMECYYKKHAWHEETEECRRQTKHNCNSAFFRQYLKLKPIFKHKCVGCGDTHGWNKGNNYHELWKSKQYYCRDEKLLLDFF